MPHTKPIMWTLIGIANQCFLYQKSHLMPPGEQRQVSVKFNTDQFVLFIIKKLPTFIAIINLKTITKMLHNYIFKFSYNNHIKTVYVNSIKTVYVTWMIHHFVHVLRICYVNIMYFSLRNILRNYYVKKSTRFFVIIT